MTFDALAIPSIDGVPTQFRIDGGGVFMRRLARTLLDTGVVEHVDVANPLRPEPATPTEVVQYALERHWDEITRRLRIFDWNLRITPRVSGNYSGPRDISRDLLYAEIETTGGPISCHTVTLSSGTERLERVRAGLGQTVLAALYDALNMLPLVVSPRMALELAEFQYWGGEIDEEIILKEAAEMHGVASTEELLRDTDFFTPSQFFESIPRWVARPKRVLTHRQCARAARCDAFARDVVDAMDAVYTSLLHDAPFPRMITDDNFERVDFALIVHWAADDVAMRVVDDYGNDAIQGDYAEASAVAELSMQGDSIARWLDRMRATARLAATVERVLALFAAQQPDNRVRIHV